MTSTVSASSNPIPEIGWPTMEVGKALIAEVWDRVNEPKAVPLKVLKGGAFLIAGIGLTAAAVTLVALGTLHHLVTFPSTVREWTRDAIREHAASAGKELITLFIAMLAAPLTLSHKVWGVSHGDPILLVHGAAGNSSCWFYHIREMEKQGLGPIHVIDLGSPLQDEQKFVDQIDKKIGEIHQKHGKKVKIIGHSMGGYLSTVFASRETKDRVDSVLSLGSPISPAGSDGTDKLSLAVAKQTSIKFTQVATQNDLLVRPIERAHTAATASHIHKITIRGLGHIAFIHSKEINDMMIYQAR